MVEAQVIPTEKATSPRHRKLITLLETPPGQHPTKRIPKAKAGSNLHTRTNKYAIPGIIINWAQAPTKISSGRLAKTLKSLVDKVSPIVNMMIPKITVCVFPLTQSKR